MNHFRAYLRKATTTSPARARAVAPGLALLDAQARRLVSYPLDQLECLTSFIVDRFYEIGDERVKPNGWHVLALMLAVGFLFLLVIAGLMAPDIVAIVLS